MEDAAIIELYFARREEAITESDRKYGRYCTVIASNILKNREDAEECVSDTWLRAWRAIPPTRPSVLKIFFGKITRNLSLNRWEKEHAAKRGGDGMDAVLEELEECIADAGAAGWSADRAVLTDVLNCFLSELKPEQRVMFVRRYWYMDPVKVIAEELGCGESKVKMTLSRAREKLAARLKEEGIEV